jgi:hypothetical protein
LRPQSKTNRSKSSCSVASKLIDMTDNYMLTVYGRIDINMSIYSCFESKNNGAARKPSIINRNNLCDSNILMVNYAYARILLRQPIDYCPCAIIRDLASLGVVFTLLCIQKKSCILLSRTKSRLYLYPISNRILLY